MIYEILGTGVDLLVHAGPSPNLMLVNFDPLSNIVVDATGNRYVKALGRGVPSSMNGYAWFVRLLASKAALLRAPFIAHIILEDWLIAQPVR